MNTLGVLASPKQTLKDPAIALVDEDSGGGLAEKGVKPGYQVVTVKHRNSGPPVDDPGLFALQRRKPQGTLHP